MLLQAARPSGKLPTSAEVKELKDALAAAKAELAEAQVTGAPTPRRANQGSGAPAGGWPRACTC